jgi:hypothetical protein
VIRILATRTDQRPFVNPLSRVVIIGQNPSSRIVTGTLREQYPFGFEPKVPVNEQLARVTRGAHHALAFIAEVKRITGEWPTLGNLVYVPTEHNRIDHHLVLNYTYIPKILGKASMLIALGKRTGELFSKCRRALDPKEQLQRIFVLDHPSYVWRFKHAEPVEMWYNGCIQGLIAELQKCSRSDVCGA